MYLAVILILVLGFSTLCLIGLLALIKQAIDEPAFTATRTFFEDPSPPLAAPSKDAEGGACGEGCA